MIIHRFRSSISSLLLFVGLFSAVVAFAAGTPAKLIIKSGNRQNGTVGDSVANPFVAIVEDANGDAVSGIEVDWNANVGGGSFPVMSTTTDGSGQVSNTFKLGTVPGYDTATAKVHNTYISAAFGATASSGPAVKIEVYSGNNQTGTVGAPLSAALQVICKDKYGNGAAHTEVDWTVTGGGGSVPYPYSLTQTGVATKVLTLGTAPGTNMAVATIKGTEKSYSFTAQAVAGPVAAIAISSGNDQIGNSDSALPNPLGVVAQDAYGNPRSGIQVNWLANTAGDAFSSAYSVTNSSGVATNSLTLGTAFGLHKATASIHGVGASQTFLATEGVSAVVSLQNGNTNPAALKPYFLGLSYQKDFISDSFFSASNLPLVALFQKLGPGVLRLNADRPSGPPVWDENGPGLKYGIISRADMARFEAFLQATNWKVLYGIALIGNQASCDAGKTNCAANEAAAASDEFGSSLMGFELGNEPDVYADPVYGNPAVPQIPGYTYQNYTSTTPVYYEGKLLPTWPIFAAAIQAAVPGASLTGPTAGWDWVIPFAQGDEASKLSLLTRHYYRSYTNASPTVADLLAPDPEVATQFPVMAQAAAAAAIPGGYRISECNSVAGYMPDVSNAFGTALWTIDFLFQNALYQSTGVNFNSGGDPGGSYSPILDNGTKVVGIGPDYYGLLAYSLLMKGGRLLTIQVNPSPPNFSAYAVQQPNGTTDLILSNKDSENIVTVGVARSGSIKSATSLLLTAPSLTAKSGFELGGSAVNIDGSWEATSNPGWPIIDNSAVVTVPAGSAQIVHLK